MSTVSIEPIHASPAAPEGQNAPLAPMHIPAGTGVYTYLGDHRAHGKVGSLHTNGAFLFAETAADYQGGVPTHTHTREDETFYILEGRFEVQVGGRTLDAGPGDTVFAPRDVPHAWRCTNLEGGRFLILVTPGANFEAFAIGMARDGVEPLAAVSNPATRAAFLARCEDAGIYFETGQS